MNRMPMRTASAVSRAEFRGTSTDAWSDAQIQRTTRNLFITALVVRLIVIVLLAVLTSELGALSRDSVEYDHRGRAIAELYATGQNVWSAWIDDAWFQYVGLVYYLVGPHLFLVQATNAVFASGAAVLVFRSALLVSGQHNVARTCGYLFALIPSVVYYTALPLKEGPAVFAAMAICYGVIKWVVHGRRNAWGWMAVGLLVITGLRVYLVVVFAAGALICLLPLRMKAGIGGLVQLAFSVTLCGLFAYSVVVVSGLEVRQYESFRYYDVDYINTVRHDMVAGRGRMFQEGAESTYGENWIDNTLKFVKGVFFFLFSIDILNITRSRQLAAIPEMLFFLYCIPYLAVGVVQGWRTRPRLVLPVLVFGLALVFVYGSTATNMGAMYRWRMQGIPFLIILIVYVASIRRKGLMYALIRKSGSPNLRAA